VGVSICAACHRIVNKLSQPLEVKDLITDKSFTTLEACRSNLDTQGIQNYALFSNIMTQQDSIGESEFYEKGSEISRGIFKVSLEVLSGFDILWTNKKRVTALQRTTNISQVCKFLNMS
jgi:hypothetical protein